MKRPSRHAVVMIQRVLAAAWLAMPASIPSLLRTRASFRVHRPLSLTFDFGSGSFEGVDCMVVCFTMIVVWTSVYEELNFPAGLSSRERSALVDTVRAHYERTLRRLGTGVREDLSDDEARVCSRFILRTCRTRPYRKQQSMFASNSGAGGSFPRGSGSLRRLGEHVEGHAKT
jgi:hypothetical protein